MVTHPRAPAAPLLPEVMNPYLAVDGLALIGQGIPADDALAYLVEQDPGREGRQLRLVDFQGGSASHTGSLPEDWKGHRTGYHYARQRAAR